MNDVWFGSDLTHRDLNVISQSLSLLGREPSLIAIGENGKRLVLASRALFKLFGVTDGDDLAARLLSGADAGSQRLIALAQHLALDGAPRLERLRFMVGSTSEVITFICRRIVDADGEPLLIAAALGIPFEDAQAEPADRPLPREDTPAREVVAEPALSDGANTGLTIQEIMAALRARWPASRSLRFLWRTDANLTCTDVTAPLAAIVGQENADLLDRSLADLAARLDVSGQLGALVAGRQTWSGVDVLWPIADAPAAVQIGLGAMSLRDHDGSFEGYRGYGVIHLDRVVPHAPTRLQAPAVPRSTLNNNVVTFPGGAGPKSLTVEDQQVFEEIGEELRDQVGVPPVEPAQVMPDELADETAPPVSADAEMPAATAVAEAEPNQPAAPTPTDQVAATHEAEIARNALTLLNRLSVALLVSRDNIPIFANRAFLEMTGFDDEDDLHASGGMAHLFGDLPGNNTGAETVSLRSRNGGLVAAAARMQRIDWDGLPATLLTLQHVQAARICPPQTEAAAADPASRQADTGADVAEADVSAAPPDSEPPSTEFGSAELSADRDDELRELRAILETATDGVAVIDAEGNVVSLNRSGEALFGCDRNAVIGKPFLDLFAPQNQDLASDYFGGLKSNATRSLLNDGREIMIKAYQGGTIPVFMTLGRLGHSGESGGGSPRYCALFRDLTPWKRVERDLESARHDAEHASALKSDFLARVNHEIRTPITAIIGFAETMSEERFGPIGSDRYKEYLRDIRASGALVVSLVNDLLDLSKIEAGKMDLALDPLDVNKIVGECAALMQPQSARERVIMRLSLAGNLPQIRADDRALRQIVLNILSNAVKFNEPGGQVILATAITEAGCVVIRVRDTGPGMSEGDLAVALEPFRQLATVRGVGGGTGLGLPLTKALVEANDAVFTIRSKVQQGTLVEVSFPPARVLAGNG